MFPERITHKVTETNSTFHMEWHIAGKVEFLCVKSFILILTKLSFWQGDWALGFHSMELRQFPGVSKFPKIVSLKSISNL